LRECGFAVLVLWNNEDWSDDTGWYGWQRLPDDPAAADAFWRAVCEVVETELGAPGLTGESDNMKLAAWQVGPAALAVGHGVDSMMWYDLESVGLRLFDLPPGSGLPEFSVLDRWLVSGAKSWGPNEDLI
jgi:hypothetical protein